MRRSFSGVKPDDVDNAPRDLAPGDSWGLDIGIEGGGTSSGGMGGALLLGLLANELPWERGRGGSGAALFDFRTEDDRMLEGSDATGRWSGLRELPAVRGRPL